MAADDALITLGELLQVPPPSARRGASASAALPTATRPVAPPAHQLHSSLFKELSAVDALFSRWQAGGSLPFAGLSLSWVLANCAALPLPLTPAMRCRPPCLPQAEVEAKQRAAAAACDFEDHAAFSAALLVLNKRGERRRGTRAAQASRPRGLVRSGWLAPPCQLHRSLHAAAGQLGMHQLQHEMPDMCYCSSPPATQTAFPGFHTRLSSPGPLFPRSPALSPSCASRNGTLCRVTRRCMRATWAAPAAACTSCGGRSITSTGRRRRRRCATAYGRLRASYRHCSARSLWRRLQLANGRPRQGPGRAGSSNQPATLASLVRPPSAGSRSAAHAGRPACPPTLRRVPSCAGMPAGRRGVQAVHGVPDAGAAGAGRCGNPGRSAGVRPSRMYIACAWGPQRGAALSHRACLSRSRPPAALPAAVWGTRCRRWAGRLAGAAGGLSRAAPLLLARRSTCCVCAATPLKHPTSVHPCSSFWTLPGAPASTQRSSISCPPAARCWQSCEEAHG